MKLLHARLALAAIAGREIHKFLRQPGRLASSLVRPLLWMVVFSAGFRQMPDLGTVMPFDPNLDYRLYMVPGLALMVCLFNGMQSSLAMVYDREMGVMRLLLTAPLPRTYLLACKLMGGAFLSVLQALAFVAVAALLGTTLPVLAWAGLHALVALICGAQTTKDVRALLRHFAGLARRVIAVPVEGERRSPAISHSPTPTPPSVSAAAPSPKLGKVRAKSVASASAISRGSNSIRSPSRRILPWSPRCWTYSVSS